MLGAADGNVDSRGAAATAAATGAAAATAAASAAPAASVNASGDRASDSVADASDKVDEATALMLDCLANVTALHRKRNHQDLERLAGLHSLNMQEELSKQKTAHDEVDSQAQKKIKEQDAKILQQDTRISQQDAKISQQEQDIQAHLATISSDKTTLKLGNDEQERLEAENTALKDKMRRTWDLFAQLQTLMDPVPALAAASATSCRQENLQHLPQEAQVQNSQQSMLLCSGLR